MNKPPRVGFWHVYADADGITHQRRCELRDFRLAAIQGKSTPQWLGSPHYDGATVFVTVQPGNWEGGWHTNPRPQWIVPLSGSWWVETMDGHRVEMGPGDLSYGEDRAARARDGKEGHLSGTLGEAPAVLMLVQFDTLRDDVSVCPFA